MDLRRFLPVVVLAGALSAKADVIVTGSGPQTGEIVRVNPTSITFKLPAGEISIPRSEITDVQVPQPAAYTAAVNALSAMKYAEAVQALKPAVDRLAGLEIDWVQDAMLKLGDALVGAKSFAEAKAMFDKFKTLYPQSPKVAGLDAKYAHILVDQKQYAEAEALLTKLITPLLAKKSISQEEELTVAEGLVLLGDCQRAANKLDDALDSYLNVLALFDVDPGVAAEAKYKAAQIFEQKKNWKRAKGEYKDLSESAPQPEILADAKKRFAALSEAHPE